MRPASYVGGQGDIHFRGPRRLPVIHHFNECILVNREVQALVESFLLGNG
jgi:hypothetical protein